MKYQYSFFKYSLEHGGELSAGRRKNRRPLSSKKPIHITLKSNFYFLRKLGKATIDSQVRRWSERFGIKVYKYSIQSNHLHLCICGTSVKDIQNFLRVLSGQIAQKLFKFCKGVLPRSFWKNLVHTRIVEWGRAFKAVIAYIEQNELEVLGLVPYRGEKPAAEVGATRIPRSPTCLRPQYYPLPPGAPPAPSLPHSPA